MRMVLMVALIALLAPLVEASASSGYCSSSAMRISSNALKTDRCGCYTIIRKNGSMLTCCNCSNGVRYCY